MRGHAAQLRRARGDLKRITLGLTTMVRELQNAEVDESWKGEKQSGQLDREDDEDEDEDGDDEDDGA